MRKAAVVLLSTALALVVAGRSAPALERSERLVHDGLERTFQVVVPDRHPAAGRGWPLVVVLHGGGGRGAYMVRVSGFKELALREGFVAVFPDALNKHWNDGREDEASPSHRDKVDDLGFLLAVIDRLAAALPLDRRRVYALGASNGGMMVQRLGCAAAERFAALASIIASMPEPLVPTCRPARPVAMLLINGTADPMVPWAGGQVGTGRKGRGRVVSTRATVDLWVAANGCRPVADSFLLADRDPGDGVLIRASRWRGCRQGAEVLLYAMDGAGHRWPGVPESGFPLLKRLMGPQAMDIDTAGEVWAFFRAHPR